MTLRHYIQKNFTTLIITLGVLISVDAYRIAIGEKSARIQAGINEATRLSNEIKKYQDTIISNQDNQTKIASLSTNASESFQNVVHEGDIVKKLIKQLTNKDISQDEKDLIVKEMEHHTNNQIKAMDSANSELEKIKEIVIDKPKENIINHFNDILDSYKEFLSTLSLDQIAAIAHLFGFVLILSCLFSLLAIIYGDFLIDYFKIENKYPRISRYIKIRKKAQRFFMTINFILIFLTIIFLFLFNCYIFINNPKI